MKFNFLLMLLTSSLLYSCAGSYHPGNPASFNYKTLVKNNEAKIDYYLIWDVFMKRGCLKYANKEKHKNVNMVAVKITNTGEQLINITSDNLIVYSNGQQQKLLQPDEFYTIIKQKKGFYFFWLVPNTGISTIVAFVNFFVAKSANKFLRYDLKDNYLIGRSIEPGGSAYGYIYLTRPPSRDLTIEIK